MNRAPSRSSRSRVCHAQIFAAYVPVRSEFSPGAERRLDFLEELMAAVAAASPAARKRARRLPRQAYRPPPRPPAVSRRFRQLAQAKLTEVKPPDPKEAISARVSDALQRASKYLRELAEQLNIVQPAFAKGYTIVGLPEFSGLAGRAAASMCACRMPRYTSR